LSIAISKQQSIIFVDIVLQLKIVEINRKAYKIRHGTPQQAAH